ncbi:MAG: hypothetical protein RMI56_06680 [Sulfolobales archaeon]|nr:hypothetical protein [Sulfolobales archaeon]MDW8083460.1 hypothetical protein [Sulfolobales archaeon]
MCREIIQGLIPHFAKSYSLLLLLSLAVGAVSTYLHIPSNQPPLGILGLMYTDVVFGVFYPRFMNTSGRQSEFWYNTDVLKSLLEGRYVCPIPYLDYMFEYPPVIGLLWYFTTCFSLAVAFGGRTPESTYIHVLHRVAELHYTLSAVFLTLFLLSATYFAYKLGVALDSSFDLMKVAIWLILPSTILYTVYNWDIICAALALGSLVAFQKKRYLTSGVLLGLSIATKVLTVSIAYVIFISLLMKLRKNGELYPIGSLLIGILLSGLTPYIALLLLAPRGFFDFIAHHSTWYCENCLYLILIHNIFDPLHRFLALASISVLLVVLTLIIAVKNAGSDVRVFRLSAVSILGVVLFNYVFTPQMILLFSLLALIFFSRASRVAYIVSDVANFSIMLFFYNDEELRYFFNRLGVPVETSFSPWTIDSPVQWFAAVRNILLLAILLNELVVISRNR